jgi:predicted ATPase
MSKSSKTPGKIVLTHPRTGTSFSIDSGIYKAFETAIIRVLKQRGELTFSELNRDVESIIMQEMPNFEGSVPWYTVSVRLDLETRGVVETIVVKGKKINRLKNL